MGHCRFRAHIGVTMIGRPAIQMMQWLGRHMRLFCGEQQVYLATREYELTFSFQSVIITAHQSKISGLCRTGSFPSSPGLQLYVSGQRRGRNICTVLTMRYLYSFILFINFSQVNFFIGAFYDGVYLLGMVLNETLTEGEDIRNGLAITKRMWSRDFHGKYDQNIPHEKELRNKCWGC